MVAHGLAASALFALAGLTYESVQSRRLLLTRGASSWAPHLAGAWFLVCAINMGAPPTLNLQAELFLLTAIGAYRATLLVPLVAALFFSAAYSLHLYTVSQHGPTPSFLAGGVPCSPRALLMVALHLRPIVRAVPLALHFGVS
jgi:NADH-ubiquinone oxidoreductase chain 4